MTVTSVDRAFRLLRAVPQTNGTLTALSRETGLAVATVSRLMETLEHAGLLSAMARPTASGQRSPSWPIKAQSTTTWPRWPPATWPGCRPSPTRRPVWWRPPGTISFTSVKWPLIMTWLSGIGPASEFPSGGYSHFSEASVAMGYVRAELAGAREGEGSIGFEILGVRRPATLVDGCLWDPDATRKRG